MRAVIANTALSRKNEPKDGWSYKREGTGKSENKDRVGRHQQVKAADTIAPTKLRGMNARMGLEGGGVGESASKRRTHALSKHKQIRKHVPEG